MKKSLKCTGLPEGLQGRWNPKNKKWWGHTGSRRTSLRVRKSFCCTWRTSEQGLYTLLSYKNQQFPRYPQVFLRSDRSRYLRNLQIMIVSICLGHGLWAFKGTDPGVRRSAFPTCDLPHVLPPMATSLKKSLPAWWRNLEALL